MPRVKRGVTAKARHKKVLDQAKGYYGARSRTYRMAKQAVIKAGQYAYRDRRQKKRQFRALWIVRINAGARECGLSYSRFIDGLKNIFTNYELEIYNRWGRLIWTGNNQSPDWDGFATKGMLLDNQIAPKGTYYYILNLNDDDYPEPIVGWLYLTK